MTTPHLIFHMQAIITPSTSTAYLSGVTGGALVNATTIEAQTKTVSAQYLTSPSQMHASMKH